MKKLIQLILAGIMILPMSLNAQNNAKSFVQQYKKQEGFTVVTIGKPVMKILRLFENAMDGNDAAMIRCVDVIHVLNFEGGRDGTRGKPFISEALTFCEANRYEELIEVVEQHETLKFLGKTDGEYITSLIVLTYSNGGNNAEMVCLTGNLTIDVLQAFYGGKGTKKNVEFRYFSFI